MQGEPVEAAELGPSGMAGDRRWAVQVAESGRVLSAKREGRLLAARARTADPVEAVLPSGRTLAGPGPGADAALTDWLGQPVRLVEADPEAVPTFESQADEADDTSGTATWQGRPGIFVDSSPLHLLTTASLRAVTAERPDLDWAVARFRPNLLVDVPGTGRPEDAWVGGRVGVGDVELAIVKPCTRCVMVTRAQPGLERRLDVLTHLTRTAAGTLGVLAGVVRPGTVTVGAPVHYIR